MIEFHISFVFSWSFCNVNSGEEHSPAAPVGIRTNNLSITSPALLPTSYPGSPVMYSHNKWTSSGLKRSLGVFKSMEYMSVDDAKLYTEICTET